MHEPVMHILLVEDNPGDTRLIRTLLTEVHAQDFDLHDVDSLAEALQYLAVEQIDVILLELSLPDSQGLDTFFHLHDTSPKLPIIVLTGLDDTTIALHAIRAGAQDYLVKGTFSGEFLMRAMQYAIERHRMFSAFERQARSMRTYRAYLSDIIAKHPDGIIVTTNDGMVRLANHAAGVLFGRDPQQLTGNKLPVALPEAATSLTLPGTGTAQPMVEIGTVAVQWEGQDAALLTLHTRNRDRTV